MDYVQFGRTGIRVSPICLGTGNFGWITSEADSIRVIHMALDAGINFVDTANVYNDGVSEEIVGKALADGRREHVVLATKANYRVGDGPNQWGNSRRHVMQEIDTSLRRLRTDWVDLYQLHHPDPTTPIDETLRALDDLVRQGKVRYVGSSNLPAWRHCEALWQSDVLSLARFVSDQSQYNLIRRGLEREMFPLCLKHESAILAYSPLAGGWLSGKVRPGQTSVPDGTKMAAGRDMFASPQGQRRLETVEKLIAVADEKGCPLSQFALAWCMRTPPVAAAITGAHTEEQLRDCLAALAVEITDDDRARVDAIVPPGTDGA